MIDSRAGKYDRRVTIQQIKSAASQNGYGEVDKTDANQWETYATRWANVVPQSGAESTQAKQVVARGTHTVFLRSDSLTRAITTKMRLLHGSVYLNIEDVHDAESALREVRLQCTEAK